MRFSYFDDKRIPATVSKKKVAELESYQEELDSVAFKHDSRRPEYSLVYPSNPDLHDTIDAAQKHFKGIKHLVLVGVGGSSLGVEAVHTALGEKNVRLSVLDTIAPYEIDILLTNLERYKKVSQIGICVVSKSGATTETVANATVVLTALQKRFGKDIYKQTVCISNPKSPLLDYAKKMKAVSIEMPKSVGGRFSVSTEVGLVPLALLGHDVDAYIAGLLDANSNEFDSAAAEGAARIYHYLDRGFRHYNFFAFDKRLAQVGAWYRQLFAESLGKQKTRKGKKQQLGMLPTITTAVELHSVGQLYFSGFSNVYTEFVTFDDDEHDHKLPKNSLAPTLAGFSNQEVATAMYAGVISAYQDSNLPYRSVIFDDENLAYSLGLYMGMRMREVMYVAELMDVDAFTQPNVELYKKKTKKVLGLK